MMFNLGMKKVFMGPEEKTFNQGFEDLFQVEDDYRIPAPSGQVRDKLDRMSNNGQTIFDNDKEGMNSAMDSVFGFMKKDKHGSPIANSQSYYSAPQQSSYKPSGLQAVQTGSSQLNIVVVEPRSFEDSLQIVNYLKERKSVIVNLQYLERDLSQRVIDFVSGATLALDGTQERVGHGVFIFASMNCQVETESESVRAYKDLFSKTFG